LFRKLLIICVVFASILSSNNFASGDKYEKIQRGAVALLRQVHSANNDILVENSNLPVPCPARQTGTKYYNPKVEESGYIGENLRRLNCQEDNLVEGTQSAGAAHLYNTYILRTTKYQLENRNTQIQNTTIRNSRNRDISEKSLCETLTDISIRTMFATSSSGERAKLLYELNKCQARSSFRRYIPIQLLEKKFGKLQEKPEYYYDKWYRKRVVRYRLRELLKYKPNLGKKIFMKSYSEREFRRNIKLFGKVKERVFIVSAIDIKDDLAPYINHEMKKLSYGKVSKYEFEDFKDKFQNWGYSYFDLRHRGKIKNKLVVGDGEYGNFIFLNKKAFFIKERYQDIIDILMKFKEGDGRRLRKRRNRRRKS